jgi:hypothetical protein
MSAASDASRQRRVNDRSKIGKDPAVGLDVRLRPGQAATHHGGAMKLFAALLGALALVAGVVGGTQAYLAAAATPPVAPHVVVSDRTPVQGARPGVVVRWAPCHAPAVRHGKVCVRHVTRTVTVPAPAVVVQAAPATTRPAAPVRTNRPALRPTHEPAEHESSDDGDHHEDEGDEHEGEHDD